MALANTIKRGDIVGVVGQPGKTKRGELSIFPTSLELLTPCLHMMPKTTYGARRSTARPDAHPGAPCPCAGLARGVRAVVQTVGLSCEVFSMADAIPSIKSQD